MEPTAWTLGGWVIGALGLVYAVVVKRYSGSSPPPDVEKFQNLYSQVQRIERDVAEWHDYVGRWTKRLDMRVRRASGEVEETSEGRPVDRKMELRRVLGRGRE